MQVQSCLLCDGGRGARGVSGLRGVHMLSQINPWAQLLVVPFVNSFKFQPCDHTSYKNPKTLISHKALKEP